jgi:plastocyanin
MKRILAALSVVLVLFGSLVASGPAEAGGGGHSACGTSSPVSQATGTTVEVAVTDNCFGPVVARIAPGTEVRWVNKGNQLHNVADVANPSNMPKMLQTGASVTMKFDDAGAFMYYCSIHPGMMGAVFVGETSSEANPEIVPSKSSPGVVPPAAPGAPSLAGVQVQADSGDGLPLVTVLFLALAVGAVAGGGSRLLVRRLASRSN